MIENNLINELRKQQKEILNILAAGGVDVSRYRGLSEELEKQQEERKRRHAERNKKYRAGATAFLNKFVNAGAREKGKNAVRVLSEFIEEAEKAEKSLKRFIQATKRV